MAAATSQPGSPQKDTTQTAPQIPARPLLEAAFDMAPIGLVVTENRVLRECNNRFCEMFGYERAEMIGELFAFLYPSRAEFENITHRGRECLRKGTLYWDERVMRRKDGDLFWVRVRGHSFTPNSPLAHAVWSFADLSASRPYHPLTRREREVYTLLAQGMTSKEIARELSLSHRTIEVHRARLLRKVGVNNTAALFSSLGDISGGHVVGS
ncbi:PAS domain S-box protein [Epibacterium sp. SM1969]|uniref:PAS domain S-box protein n=1 Tax=Tritonibacter aquimaris TaxID=2663379 RepID=A0A844AM97_9RHOB|nr:LuxR C-terminal-related transcriptional regulator [Tritonibacter aquimaris]MQY43400.1 PAS domain S-box protein [Tritonibacter aquimaris]